MFKRAIELAGGKSSPADLEPGKKMRLSGKATCVPIRHEVFQIEMGDQVLCVYPDPPLTATHRAADMEFRILDPARYFTRVGHGVRMQAGTTFSISHETEGQEALFGQPRDAFRHRLTIRYDTGTLSFSDRVSDLGTYLTALPSEDSIADRLVDARRDALKRIVEYYGGPLRPLPAEQALATIRKVNDLLRESLHRERDAEGNPGGLMDIPDRLTPIIVGDLHARADNLLSILCENDFLGCLERDEGVLILLGDAVHSDDPRDLKSMEHSMLIMDLIFKLMLAVPGRFHMLLGNHDSFSPEVMKAGVPQSILWEKALKDTRGPDYCAEMETFYQLCPLVARSEDFAACHAGPPRSRVTREALVNARQAPALLHELTWNRVRGSGNPGGYGRGDVKRFRKSLDLPKRTTFVVGHFILTEGATLWKDVRGIEGHHILYASLPGEVAAITRVDGHLVSQLYRAEPLLDWANANLSDG